jgi:hypothetical protein
MTPITRQTLSFLAILGALTLVTPAWAITLGQIDDFQDGTTQGWRSGAQNPNPPINVADVGPAGAGDHSLQITSTGGFGAGSALVAFNTAQWSGDYGTEQVTMIVVDVNNVGPVSLTLRFAFDGAGGRFSSTVGVSLAAGSGWQTIGFLVEAGDLTSVGGTDVNATLASVSQLRLLHASSPAFMGDRTAAQLWVDNVVAVPEPSTLLLLAAGIAALRAPQIRRPEGRGCIPARARSRCAVAKPPADAG